MLRTRESVVEKYWEVCFRPTSKQTNIRNALHLSSRSPLYRYVHVFLDGLPISPIHKLVLYLLPVLLTEGGYFLWGFLAPAMLENYPKIIDMHFVERWVRFFTWTSLTIFSGFSEGNLKVYRESVIGEKFVHTLYWFAREFHRKWGQTFPLLR